MPICHIPVGKNQIHESNITRIIFCPFSLEFEAVLLDVNKDRKNQLWIHAKIKACVSPKDCDPVSIKHFR